MPVLPMCHEHKLAGMEVIEVAKSLNDSNIAHTGTQPHVHVSLDDNGTDGSQTDEDEHNMQTNQLASHT